MLNIIIPMAGLGSRFSKAGYTDPKPLIRIHSKQMIQIVIENLTPNCEHKFTFIVRDEHISKYGLDKYLKQWAPNCNIIELDHKTEGPACTVLMARDIINNNNPIMIANCDQYVDCNIDDYINKIGDNDGLIMTFKDNQDKWSYIEYDDDKNIIGVVEKVVVSDDATTGIYNFAKGLDFVKYADDMIANEQRVNGEFYVAPVYTNMCNDNKKLTIFNIDGMYGLGVPDDLEYFLKNEISNKIKS